MGKNTGAVAAFRIEANASLTALGVVLGGLPVAATEPPVWPPTRLARGPALAAWTG